ncbi:MAG: M48 family metalloprotease [Leptolyngbyaceae cyanobacterium SM2_5_2]|nr:M48 family metalloprotease [Leptolyngbyaceae cyanobacterium SM2_5_2]
MATVRRFFLLGLASFLIVLLVSRGVVGVRPGWATEPVSPAPAAAWASTLLSAEDVLQVDPASRPDHTLPTPYPEQPDGTLKLPAPAGEAEAPPADPAPPAVGETATDGDDAGVEAIEGAEEVEEAEGAEEAILSDPRELLRGLDPELAKRSELLMEADLFYLAGDIAAAEPLYRRAKDSKWLAEATPEEPILPVTNPEDLPPAGQVYWREALAGAESGVVSRVQVPLELLVKEYPEFLPGQGMYARYLVQQDRAHEAMQILEAAIIRYPYHPDLLRAQIEVQMAQEKWIEAAITANQFALLNPEHPDAEAMAQLSRENLDRFRGQMNQTLTRNLVSNIITGAAGYILTGGLLGPFTALNSGILLMQGESSLGQQVADQVMRQLPMVDDPDIRAYVNDIGQKLAALTGRDEFTYTFEVVMDDSLNAFALPGGKIFIHAGAITRSNSEAELAGLLGHEISHTVLSHGFQMATQGNLTTSLAAFIPIPELANIAATLVVSSYSRDMERQADILGTKLLSTGHYAADGLHNLMKTLKEEYGSAGISWFASHPNPEERISYLKQLVDQGGFNRYAYEGVETHLKMRHKMARLITEYKLEQGIEDEEETAPERDLM